MGENFRTINLLDRRIFVLVGGYGAGKTQLSINIALNQACKGKSVALVDLDLVNPYNRSREVAKRLEEQGIYVVKPEGALAFAENPSLVPEIEGVLRNEAWQVILDVGGDPAGATVLGRYKHFLESANTVVLQVVNIFRPFSRTIAEINQLRGQIETQSRLKVHGWINNSNLQEWTELEDWLKAQELMSDLAKETGIPLVATAVNPEWAQKVGLFLENDWITVERFLKPHWKR